MGKQIDLLRKLIKEELEIALNETDELYEESISDVVDYLFTDEIDEVEELEEA